MTALARRLSASSLALAAWLCVGSALAGGPAPAPAPQPPPPAPLGPPTVLHVPADELDVLLKAQGRAVVLTYAEYEALLAAARAKVEGEQALPPVDAVRLSAEGALDLTPEGAATLRVEYRVRGLAPGPRSVGFASGGVAWESVKVEPEGDAGPARYEERDGQGRLYLDGPGVRRVTVEGSAVPARRGAERLLDLWLPNPAAMGLAVTVPAGMEATLTGEGPVQRVLAPAEKALVVRTRPTRGGNLKILWAPQAHGTEGPSVLDADVKTLYTLGDGVVDVQALIAVDVLRTASDSLALEIPADLAVHGVEGAGVTGHARSEDRRRLTVRLEKPVLGAVKLLLKAERPLPSGAAAALPRVIVSGALRHQGEVALRFGADVNPRAVTVVGGRRVAAPGAEAARQGVLRYSLMGEGAGLTVDLEPGRLRVDATSTYYLNLAEPGRTLLASTTYRVLEGTLFRLSPRFPAEFELRELTLNGNAQGFTKDRTADGRVEITLGKGVGVGGEVLLLATLERAEADWVPEKAAVPVAFPVPSSGATREEGYLAVGADAGFEVLETASADLRPVGAADLTARGLSAAGLVYGYRLDGAAPAVTLNVTRREPLIDAEVVTSLYPGMRRLDLAAHAIYRIQRAGVRRLFLDLPDWAGEQVDIQAAGLRVATRLSGERRPADVPAGYERWQIDLEQRAIGAASVRALWFLDQTEDDWALPASRAVMARVPLERAQRFLVVGRSAGLEVSLPTLAATNDLRRLDVAELPPEASVDALTVLDVLRVPAGRDGLDLSVKKHAGSAVLDAIATEVRLATALGREGILRTRATVELFNIDRQFLEVALPPDSALIGAVVDGVPIKPLVNPQGALLVTVPTTRGKAASGSARTLVALTYETRLGAPLGEHVRVLSPVFPGLEVLRTTHEVGVEPELEIAAVSGDLLPKGRVARPARQPWLLGALERMAPREVAAPAGGSAPASGLVHGGDDGGGRDSLAYARTRKPGGSLPPTLREPTDPAAPPPPPAAAPAPTPSAPPTVPLGPPSPDAAGDGAARAEQKPGAEKGDDHNETDNDQPFEESLGERAGLSDAPPEGRAPRQGAGKSGPGEGGEAGRTGRPDRPGRAKKGQLSLDVPVFLAPNRVVASRIGGGGALELDLVSTESRLARYRALLLLSLALGLLVVGARLLPGWLTVLSGLAAALILSLTLGEGAGALPSALTDAATVLAGLLALRWAGVRLARVGRAAPAAPGALPPTAAVLLAVLVSGLAAGPARADDAPAAPEAEAAEPGTVIAPLSPEKGAVLSDGDRVFVPLAVWLDLQRKAYPERDPELVALGQVVTLVEASYRMDVGSTSAEGSARFVFAQRGRGVLLVALPLPGLAITEARLNGRPVRLLLDGAQYRVPLERQGEAATQDHVLELTFQVPVAAGPGGRSLGFGGPTFAASTLDVTAGDFAGDLRVSGAGRVVVLASPASGEDFHARAYLGRHVSAKDASTWTVTLAERSPASLPAEVRTRAESRTVHSLRDGGTETIASVEVHVLQGRAPFVDLALPAGVDVLEATGPNVARWETGPGRLRLVLTAPTEGKIALRVRAFQAAAAPERREDLPELAVRDTTGESGVVIVNGDASLKLTVEASEALFRTGRPGEADAAGGDAQGRVAGAWRFAARPARVAVVTQRSEARTELTSRVRVTLGDDRARALLEGTVRVQRAPLGDLTFRLPGSDEVRGVDGSGVQTWWLSGEGDQRRLHVRFGDLFEGDRTLAVRLERRLGGQRDGLVVPRWRLEGAQADRGLLIVFALPDVEPQTGSLAGLKALPPGRLAGQEPNVPGARATHAFEWEAAVEGALPLVLRAPEQELEAVVVTQVSPSDEEQRLEHLVLFDVRRGAADTLRLFLPDGGLARSDVVRARDLREVRSERATRRDADGQEVNGLLYTVRLQSPRSGLIEVTASQLWPAGYVVRVPRPEGVKATRWFGLVRTFLDGTVEVQPGAGAPDAADWADLPFLPTGVEQAAVLRTYAARAPYTLSVLARRHRLETQADALVLASQAQAVVGLDGHARVRVTYRLFNRSRQFLRVRLPEQAVLYGAVAAGQPVKPLAGLGGSVLIPVPKVPLGGAGYEVALTYRAPAGPGLAGGGSGRLPLPEVEGVSVDRTSVRLTVPEGFAYDFTTKMSAASEPEVEGDRVEAALREATEVLKVAQQGTLEQRMFACDNSAPLVENAQAILARYKAQGSPTRAVQLEAELRKVAEVAEQAREVCRVDAGVWQNEQTLQANLAAASNFNGQSFVVLQDKEPGASGGGTGQPGAGENLGANWRFNPTALGADQTSGKKDLLDLKERLLRELERRDVEDRSKNVDVAQEGQSRAAKQAQSKEGAKQQAASDDETTRYDENRNNALMNESLRRVQVAQRQLGVEQYFQTYELAQQEVVPMAGSGGGGGGRFGYRGRGAAPEPTPALQNRDSGLFYNDGEDAQYAGRTENIFNGPLGDVPARRVGLMGVDVPLPQDGRTFWFSTPSAASPLTFEASPEGTATWVRLLIALALLGLLVYGLRLVARRRHAG